MDVNGSGCIRFDDFEFDPRSGQLLRNGQPVRIQPQPLRVLKLLLDRPGQTIPREELRDHIWGDATYVEFDQGLNYCIRQIRLALGDSAASPVYIETLPKQGYRFLPAVVHADGNGTAGVVQLPFLRPPSGSTPIRHYAWLAVACSGILAVAAVTSYRLHSRQRSVEYTQLTNFADSASAPSLSPDGHMLAFIRGSDSFLSSDQIYVKTLPHGEAKRLTDDSRWKYNPVFSADSSEIAYTAVAGSTFETRVVPVFGGESRLLLDNSAGLRWLSADEVLLSRVRSGTGLHMGVVKGKLSTQQFRDLYYPANLEEMAHYSFASPDRSVAVVMQMAKDGSWTQCRLISLDGRFPWRWVGPEGSCNAATWSPDGSWMYFTAEKEGKSHLWRQRYPNGAPEQVLFGPAEEEGVAMAPDGQSVITSFGVRQTSLWLHQPSGDRALVMEGQILGNRIEESNYPPSFSRDGKFIYYLVRRGSDLEPELSRVDVKSGKSEVVFPGVSMHDYDISADGKRVLYSCRSSKGTTDLCLASIEEHSAPRRVPVSDASFPRFGTPGKLFFKRLEGLNTYFEEVNEDGSGNQKLLPLPIFDDVRVSPSRRWLFTTFASKALDLEWRAVSLQGDAPKTYCSTACYPYWSPDGRWLYIPVEHAAGTNPGRSLAIPIGSQETLPNFPAGGIKPGTKASEMQGSVSVNREWVIPGANPTEYAYLSQNTQRNLYRITLP